MPNRRRRSSQTPALRWKAEAQLKGRGPTVSEGSRADSERLVHELQVHQLELEMQNEELRTARLAIEAGLRRYTEMFDFAPLGYVVLGLDEKIREINHAGAGLLGQDRSRLVGAHLEDFIAPNHRPTFSIMLGRVRGSEIRQTAEVEMMGGAGLRRLFTLSAVAVDGVEPATLLSFDDITEQREREERLRRAEAALREADHRKDEFMAALSHELRNPLGPIRTSLAVLADGTLEKQQEARALTIIDRQVAHLARLIDDLMDVTRIARGKIQLRRKRVELGELVRATVDDHRAGLEAAGIDLETWFADGPFWVDADPDRVVQSISNVLGNAQKYTPPEGGVQVALERAGNEARLRIRDTGAGIAPHLLSHVFEPFAQGPQPLARGRGGLGLGLAMVKGLVELHGGGVAISSDGPGRGTEVAISLPLVEAAGAQPEQPAPESPPRRSRRVLLIDDNEDAADSLADMLGGRGHDVRVAYDGPRGIEIAHDFEPEVVICDVGLPSISGYDVAQALRGDVALRQAYLIALSGYARLEDRERAREAGFDQHLAKPATVAELDRLIVAGSHAGPGPEPVQH